MRLCLLLVFSCMLLAQQQLTIRGHLVIDETAYGPGIHMVMAGQRGDPFVLQVGKEIARISREKGMERWVGGDKLFIVVSRLSRIAPVKVEFIYMRSWSNGRAMKPCIYSEKVMVQEEADGISDLIRKTFDTVKKFPQAGPPETSKAQPPHGAALFLFKIFY